MLFNSHYLVSKVEQQKAHKFKRGNQVKLERSAMINSLVTWGHFYYR